MIAGQRTVGRVTSAQLHHEAGPIALAVIKRSVDPQAELRVREPLRDPDAGGGNADEQAPEQWAAAQIVVVPPDAGQVVQRESGFLRKPRS